MREVRLNNGVVMPSIGFGVYQIPKNDTKRCVLDALEVGYRMIDTAASYFNEKEVGEAVRESGLPRESVFVTSKLWVQDYEYDDALKAAEKSLDELGLEYIDLYLLHKPYGNYYAAWRALESLYEQGRIRAIGVTSFSNERLQDLFLHNEIKPAVNQIETSTELAEQAEGALQNIVADAESAANEIQSIATASEEQSATSDEINRSINSVNELTSQSSAAMNECAQAVAELARQSQELGRLVENMKAG